MNRIILIIIAFIISSATYAQVSYVIDSVFVSTYQDDILSMPIIGINGCLVNDSNCDEYLSMRYGNMNEVSQCKMTILANLGKREIPYVAPNGSGNYLPEYTLSFAGFSMAYSVLRAGQRLAFPILTYHDETACQDGQEGRDDMLSTVQVEVSPEVKDRVACERMESLLSTTHGQEEFEICPMYRIRNSELKHFINGVLNNRFETGFCTVHPILKKGYCVVHIDIYDTSIFSVADLGCLKRCLGGIEGTKIPSFLVGRSVPSVFEKGRDS